MHKLDNCDPAMGSKINIGQYILTTPKRSRCTVEDYHLHSFLLHLWMMEETLQCQFAFDPEVLAFCSGISLYLLTHHRTTTKWMYLKAIILYDRASFNVIYLIWQCLIFQGHFSWEKVRVGIVANSDEDHFELGSAIQARALGNDKRNSIKQWQNNEFIYFVQEIRCQNKHTALLRLHLEKYYNDNKCLALEQLW